MKGVEDILCSDSGMCQVIIIIMILIVIKVRNRCLSIGCDL